MVLVLISLMVLMSSSTVVGETSTSGSLRDWLSNLIGQANNLQSTSCSSPGQCSVCSGNFEGVTCSTCKSGWTGSDCNSIDQSGEITTSSILTNATHRYRFMNEIMNGVSIQNASQPALLFRASRDGFSSGTFHTKCDNKGATIVIVKSQSGAIFGGYTSKSWASTGGYISDPSAFLFSLISSTGTERFTKLTQENGSDYKNVKGYSDSVYHAGSHGPTFGRGSDMYISDNANTGIVQTYSNLCFGYCDATMSVGEIAQSYLTGYYQFFVSDYEVYTF